MGSRIKAMNGFLSIPDAGEYMAKQLGETVSERSQNKFTRMIKQNLQLHKYGARSWQVKITDVNDLIESLTGERPADPTANLLDNEESKNKIAYLIELKEDGLIDAEKFYEAIKLLSKKY